MSTLATSVDGIAWTGLGSSGKIVQILIESKCMNPVIYFDELDKVSDTARGQEIIGILTHLTVYRAYPNYAGLCVEKDFRSIVFTAT